MWKQNDSLHMFLSNPPKQYTKKQYNKNSEMPNVMPKDSLFKTCHPFDVYSFLHSKNRYWCVDDVIVFSFFVKKCLFDSIVKKGKN